MNIISFYYFQELAKDLHMTQTAKKLHISQQTLSNHIKRLEDYYGTLLFYRKPSLSLTYAGEHMLTFAQMLIKEEINLKGIISDIESNEMGVLRFGASIVRGTICLPKIIPRFNARYPNVEIRYTDSLSFNLEMLIETGDLDFARLPFSMFSNRLGKTIRTCFEAANCTPKVQFTTAFSQLLVPLCAQGIAACFITQMNLSEVIDQFANKVNIFPLYFENKPMTQDLSLIYHKERYLPHYAKYFLDILFNYFDDLEQVHLARICK